MKKIFVLCLPALIVSCGFANAQTAPVWRESETGTRTVDGTWTWDAARKQAVGRWTNGAVANMTLVSDDGRTVVLRRYDPSGSSAGLIADYTGVRNGNTISGTVTWRDPLRKTQRTGTWSASW